MSTKIYTGFRFKTNDIYEARKQIREFKKGLYDLAQRLYFKTLVSEATAAIDLYAVGMLEEPVKNPLYEASSVIEHQQKEIKETQRRNPAYDFSFSMTVFPIEAEDKEGVMHCPRTLLGIYYCDNAEMIDFFLEQDFWEPYIFENQTDDLIEKYGEEEYERREYHWELAMPFNGTPAQTGFTIDLIPVVNGPFFTFRENAPKHMDFVPSFKDRVRAIAKETIGRSVFENAEDPSKVSMLEVMNLLQDEKEIAKVSKGIESKLKKKLTKIDLYGFDPDAKKEEKQG